MWKLLLGNIMNYKWYKYEIFNVIKISIEFNAGNRLKVWTQETKDWWRGGTFHR